MWKPCIGKNGVTFFQVEVVFKSLSKNGYRCFKWGFIILAALIHASGTFYKHFHFLSAAFIQT